MPEIENNQAAGQGENQDAGEKQPTGADQKPVENAGVEGEGVKKEGDEGGEGAQPENGEGANKAKAPTDNTSKKDEGDDEFKDEGEEPPVKPRLSAKEYIIQRKLSKLKKEQKKIDEGGEGKEGEGDEGDDEVSPEDEALIQKVVAKTFAPIIDKTQSVEDERDISDFLSKNPDFKPYEAKARRYLAHPSRRNLPVESVFYEVAGKHLMKIGAQRQQKADKEAANSQAGGGSARGGEGKKGIWNLPKDEFEAQQERIRHNQPS